MYDIYDQYQERAMANATPSEPKDVTSGILKDTRKRNRNNILICFAIILVITLIPLVNDSTPYLFNFTDDFCTIVPPNVLDSTIRIYYDDIISVYAEDTINFGAPIEGGESEGYTYGTYKNDRWGEYQLCADKDIEKVAVFETTKGFVITNVESGPTTEEFVKSVNESLDELRALGNTEDAA